MARHYSGTLLCVAAALCCALLPDSAVGGPSVGCASAGCDEGLTYNARVSTPQEPSLALRWKVHSDVTFTGSGCVSNARQVLCPTSNGFVALLGNGSTTWTFNDLDAAPYLPLETLYGDALMASPAEEGLVMHGGEVLWKVKAHPSGGASFPPTLTTGGIVIATTTAGTLWGYDTHGTPFATIWLNYTSDAGQGLTCHPLAEPALRRSRMYVPVHCTSSGRASGEPMSDSPVPPAPTSSSGSECSLLAIDQLQSLVDKLRKRWRLHLPCGDEGSVTAAMVSKTTTVAFGTRSPSEPVVWGIQDHNTSGNIAWEWRPSSSAPYTSSADMGPVVSWAAAALPSEQLWLLFQNSTRMLSLNATTGQTLSSLDVARVCGLSASARPVSKLTATPIEASDGASSLLLTVFSSGEDAYLLGLSPSQSFCPWKFHLPWPTFKGQMALVLPPNELTPVVVLADEQLAIGVGPRAQLLDCDDHTRVYSLV